METVLVGRTGLAQILEVSENTTRNWEARGVIEPECVVSGRPLFSAAKAHQVKLARAERRVPALAT